MIKSKSFWVAAVLLALIPLVALDIPKHVVDITRDVHDQIIEGVYDGYKLSHQQKVETITGILQANTKLNAEIYLKSFTAIVLLMLSIVFFVHYRKEGSVKGWPSAGITVLLLAISSSIKVYSWTSFSGDSHIKLLTITPADTTLSQIYNINFKGKVVYVDFWGTTCGPCLEEFRTFTKPLKEKYKNRKDIAYLYICGGHEMLWKQQLQKFDIAGSHLFLSEPLYSNMYKNAIAGNKNQLVAMPRYLIIDKQGKIADADAPRPSDADSISAKLDKYLALQ